MGATSTGRRVREDPRDALVRDPELACDLGGGRTFSSERFHLGPAEASCCRPEPGDDRSDDFGRPDSLAEVTVRPASASLGPDGAGRPLGVGQGGGGGVQIVLEAVEFGHERVGHLRHG